MSEETSREVVVIVESSSMVVANPELTDTCTSYSVAPEDAFQLTVVEGAVAVALLAGDNNTGTGGGNSTTGTLDTNRILST